MKTALLSLTTLLFLFVFCSSWAVAQEKPGDAPFAYAAPAFIKELDTRYPAQPPMPPSPPRYGGVLHFPAVVRAFDPTVGYRPELALVWDTLTEWEATWYFPEVQRTPVIRWTLATGWEMVNPSTWIFKLRPGVKFHSRPARQGPRDDGRGREVLLRAPEGQGAVLNARCARQDDQRSRQVHGEVRALHSGS